jgi:Putative zinc dependent peptidase (DUF5700)
MRNLLLTLTIVLAVPLASAQNTLDATQADAMLKLLEACSKGQSSQENIEQALALPGTRLIIARQNISRKITSTQYRFVLVSACKGEVLHLEPSESGVRAEKGVQGLTVDIGPSLIWGRDHLDILKQQLRSASENIDLRTVFSIASQNLPEEAVVSPRLYLVMGGGAGAAASDDGIYVDLPSNAWRSRNRDSPMTWQQMMEFFAHESHHLSYGKILDRS